MVLCLTLQHETIVTIQFVGIRAMVDTIIKYVVEVAAIIMRIAPAIEGITEVEVASEVGVEGATMIVTITETEKDTGARPRDQGAAGLEVLRVDMAGEDEGM